MMEQMEKREKTLEELMQELAKQVEDFPAEKKEQLATFIDGLLHAVTIMKEKTA